MNVKVKQGGATLVVGLVMLVVLTLLVLSAIRSGNVNMRIVGNMQAQEETAAAAVLATEQIISTNFTAAPAASEVPVTIGYSDAVASAPVPVCTASLAVMNANLDPTDPDDITCIGSATAKDTGIVYQSKDATGVGRSWCYQQQWEVRATVSDNRTGATATSVQGVSLRVPAGTLCP
ncbi:MAG: transmembrane protein [Gallionellaceae bacterium]|nr:MAG: transmembrane protein [Gallionellaceae bacterium]